MKTFKTIIAEASEAKLRRVEASIERKTNRVLQGPSFDEYEKLVNSTDRLAIVRDRLEDRYKKRSANIGAKSLQQQLATAPLEDVIRTHRDMSRMSDGQLRSRLALMGELIRNQKMMQALDSKRFNDPEKRNLGGNYGTSNN